MLMKTYIDEKLVSRQEINLEDYRKTAKAILRKLKIVNIIRVKDFYGEIEGYQFIDTDTGKKILFSIEE